MVAVFTPYSTAAPLFGTKPGWVLNELDIQRIQSYQLYEQIYWTVPDIFKVKFRGTNDKAIYIPSARTVVDTTDRYAGADFGINLTDKTTGATDTADVLAARLAFQDLFARERFRSKFDGNKLYGIMRGDWVWHITANVAKPQGSRISIVSIDPAMYFPVPDDDDIDEIIAVHLAVQITTADGPRINRLTYRKEQSAPGVFTGRITVEQGLFKLDQWEMPEARPERVIQQPTQLPPEITAIPVYHIKNFEEPGNPFGSSDIRGFEALMGAINQTVSDEDLSLALEGIGMYATDAPEPTDEDNNVIGWRLGPGRVVQHPEGTSFNRVAGVGSVAPYGDHFDRLVTSLRQGTATPDVAVGSVDVTVAQSGIALALQLSPLLAKSERKNHLIIDTHNQMFFDILNGWMPAFEQTSFDNTRVEAVCGSAVPIDRAERFSELNDMIDKGVIDAEYYRTEATKLGYVFPSDIQTRIDAQASKNAENQAAAFGTSALVANATEGEPE
jgi:hypothetical protein